jgi:hypothetical protein
MNKKFFSREVRPKFEKFVARCLIAAEHTNS